MNNQFPNLNLKLVFCPPSLPPKNSQISDRKPSLSLTDFELMRNVQISASQFVNMRKTKSKELKIANLFMASSPKDIKPRCKKRGSIKKVKEKIEKSLDHNAEHLLIIPLSKKHETKNVFYGPQLQKEDHSSDNFSKFSALPDKHQLLICESSREIICFLPSLQHQNKVFGVRKQKKLKVILRKAINIRNNNAPKASNKRKVFCEKWCLFGKLYSLVRSLGTSYPLLHGLIFFLFLSNFFLYRTKVVCL